MRCISAHTVVFVLLLLAAGKSGLSQNTPAERGSAAYFDSIQYRIDYLRNKVSQLEMERDVSYYNLKRELDHTMFVKEYEVFVADENLDDARSLVDSRLKAAEFRRDQTSVKYFNGYKDDVFALIKQQRMHYQQLFDKEKNFKKEFKNYLDPENPDTYDRTQRMLSLAIKYAEENNLTEILKSLQDYEDYLHALMFDKESEYDLVLLTRRKREFEKVFYALVAGDSLSVIREAEVLLAHCRNYSKLTNSSVKDEYYSQLSKVVTSAISDLLDKQGRESELTRYTNHAITAKKDSINPLGIFKWHDRIIVIDEFIPSSSMENVKKGEAILHADRMLATFLEKNKLCKSVSDLKYGYAFIIPYESNAKTSSFFYNTSTSKWQYIACYSVVNSPSYTTEIITYMSPLFFEDEMKTADNQLQQNDSYPENQQ